MISIRPLFAMTLGVFASWVIPSCVIDASLGHCSLQQGDTTCAALHPDGSLPFCSAGCLNSPHGNGCVAFEPEPSCYSPCGEGLTAEHNDDCPVAGTGSGPVADGSSNSTGLAQSSGEELVDDGNSSSSGSGCVVDEQCGASAPLCHEGECVSCDLTDAPGEACADRWRERPVCHEGSCVACTADILGACEGRTPVCDSGSNTCVGCMRHEQCPQSACHREEGWCLSPGSVWHVDGDAGGCVTADGSVANPYCTVDAALANVGPGQAGTLRIAALAGDGAYAEDVTITGGRVVALRGWPGVPRPRWDSPGGGPVMDVSGGAVVYLEAVRVEGSVGVEAITVSGAVLHLDESVVVLNPGGGIFASNGAHLSARNSVIGANGSALFDARALQVTDSTFALTYVTMAGNDSAGFASIRCAGASTGTMRNSIVAGVELPSIDCPAMVVEYSALDSSFMGEGLVALDSFDVGWFEDAGVGDFHLAAGHPFDDVARWYAGDPPVDLDGEPRPSRPGASDVAGADR